MSLPSSKVFITGGAGYIGSHVLLALENRDCVVVDNLSCGHFDAVPAHIPLHRLDLADTIGLQQILKQHRVDVVIHLAGLAYVGESMQDPGAYFRNNVSGTLSLLEAMCSAGVQKIVFSSSCAVYGDPGARMVTESTPIRPLSPYGESKAMCERLLAWYEQVHGIRYVALRYFNVGGADPAGRAGERHDPEPHVIPCLLRAAQNLQPAFELHGSDYATPDGTCVRDYVHVSDLALAHCRALDWLDREAGSLVVNLGGGEGVSILQLLHSVERVVGHPVPLRRGPRRPGDPAALRADCSLAREKLGWNPHLSEVDTLVSTAWQWMESRASFRAASAKAGL